MKTPPAAETAIPPEMVDVHAGNTEGGRRLHMAQVTMLVRTQRRGEPAATTPSISASTSNMLPVDLVVTDDSEYM